MLFVYHGGWPVVSRERELFPEGGKRSGREIQGKARKILRSGREIQGKTSNALGGGTERAQGRITRKEMTIFCGKFTP